MPEETKRLLVTLHDDIEALGSDIEALRQSVSRSRRVTAVLIVVVLVAALFIWRQVAYSTCSTSRSRALTGPGDDRVTQLIAAFTADLTNAKLTPAERAHEIAVLGKARARYPLIPAPAKLAKLPDTQVVIFYDAVASVDTNRAYLKQAAKHPVCSLWGIR